MTDAKPGPASRGVTQASRSQTGSYLRKTGGHVWEMSWVYEVGPLSHPRTQLLADHVCINLFKTHLDLVLPVGWSHKHWQLAKQGVLLEEKQGWNE